MKGEGSDYAERRGFSIVLDDPMLEDSLGHQLFQKGGRESHVDENLPRPAGPSAQGMSGGGRASVNELERSYSDIGGPSSSGMAIDQTNIRDNREAANHLQSADLFDNFSPVQRDRQRMQPRLADIFQASNGTWLQPVAIPNLKLDDQDEIKRRFPYISDKSAVQVQPILDPAETVKFLAQRRRLRIGLVLSGGPAPGGHNVIAGVYDYVKRSNPENQLLGFKGGLDGFFCKSYVLVTDELMNRFRNTGGFDMLWSGRGKVNDGDKPAIIEIVNHLDLQGLIIVGGDGSNSNAAILADFLAKECPQCCVIGVPKTIDGDLKSPAIECSFGFDTAAKTYSELIGNLCTDVCCAQGVYHFVRVMGRSASHLTLECAMQTRPNLAFVAEEVKAEKQSMRFLVDTICKLISERAKLGKFFGIILIPEGLIEFIPEMTCLIRELSGILKGGARMDSSKLSPAMRELWDYLGPDIQDQFVGERESSGYVQVAKIATERLLIRAVERELQEKDPDLHGRITPMHHYFGYEGRCAMPSNFDANYCYNLGYTAGCLIEHKKSGFMATVRGLEHDVSSWLPTGVPFTQLMAMQDLPDGSKIPGIKKQLVDITSPSFQVFKSVRDQWRLGDYYRCPGPIQFEGPVCEISNFVVQSPTPEALLCGSDPVEQRLLGEGRVVVPKRLGCYSPLQHERLKSRPTLPPLCENPRARCFPGQRHLSKDPYVHRQIVQYYPHLCHNSDFTLQEVNVDPNHHLRRGLRIGVFLISRPSPGCLNVLWGLHERAKITKSTILGFHGAQGLIDMKFIEFKDEDFAAYKNLGGYDLIGRTSEHMLLKPENRHAVERACNHLKLDGLVLIGSSLGMTEAAMLSEYFLKRKCRTRVIGVPATTSNNVLHELIETNIGFDTASKLYSSLIGNVLTDASSMPKYWHFIRLMGRYPSNEVLECALQTHPNVVIIGEEYGAGQKSLDDVVQDIADVVCRRANGSPLCRNFGAVLIPDGLLQHLPTMRLLLNELNIILQGAARAGEFKAAREELLAMDETTTEAASPSAEADQNTDGPQSYAARLTPWSAAVWRSLPVFIKKELAILNIELRDSSVEMELWLHQLVRQEVHKRKDRGEYKGNFQVCCHYFGYQGRSALPSVFDATLAFVHGHLAAICVESGITGHLTNVRGLCGDIQDWKLTTVPFNCLVTVVPAQQDFQVHPDLIEARHQANQEDLPIIPNAEIDLNCRALRWMKFAQRKWEDEDKFCNPGPIQFWGVPSTFYHRILHEEQADYFHMLTQVKRFTKYLQDGCDFGVEESFLKAAYVSLNGLLTLMYHSDTVTHTMAPFPKQAELESREREQYRNFYGSTSALDVDDSVMKYRRTISAFGDSAVNRPGSRDLGYMRPPHDSRLANVPEGHEEVDETSPKTRLT